MATVVVYLLGSTGRGAASPVRLVLAGAAITAVLTGAISAVVLTHGIAFNGFRVLDASARSSTSRRRWSGRCCRSSSSASVLALALAPSLNAIALGDHLASALGAKVAPDPGGRHPRDDPAVWRRHGGRRDRSSSSGSSCRTWSGPSPDPDNRWILPFSMVAGAILVLASDVIGRVVLWPSELEVSVVTAVIGAPVFILIVRRRRLAQL